MTKAELEELRSWMQESSRDIQRHVEALIEESSRRLGPLLDPIRADLAAYRQRNAAFRPEAFKCQGETATCPAEAIVESGAPTESHCRVVVPCDEPKR